MKRFISSALVLLLLTVIISGCSTQQTSTSQQTSTTTQQSESTADGKVYEMNVNLTHGEVPGRPLVQALTAIQEKSGGRLKFNFYYSNSLLTIPEVPKGVGSGVADISVFPLNQYTSLLPLCSRIASLPFMGFENIDEALVIYKQVFSESAEMQAEFTALGITPLNTYVYAPYNFAVTSTEDIRLPSDLKGMKIAMSNRELMELTSKNGGAPVTMSPMDYFSSLEKGVIDGVVNHFPALQAFGVLDLVKQNVIFGDSGTHMDFGFNVINTKSLESLPEDLRQMLMDSLADWEASEVQSIKGMQASAIKYCEEQGNKFTQLTAEEISIWKAAASEYHGNSLAELDAKGLPATELYDRFKALIAE